MAPINQTLRDFDFVLGEEYYTFGAVYRHTLCEESFEVYKEFGYFGETIRATKSLKTNSQVTITSTDTSLKRKTIPGSGRSLHQEEFLFFCHRYEWLRTWLTSWSQNSLLLSFRWANQLRCFTLVDDNGKNGKTIMFVRAWQDAFYQ